MTISVSHVKSRKHISFYKLSINWIIQDGNPQKNPEKDDTCLVHVVYVMLVAVAMLCWFPWLSCVGCCGYVVLIAMEMFCWLPWLCCTGCRGYVVWVPVNR